jgi:hypothetical protein
MVYIYECYMCYSLWTDMYYRVYFKVYRLIKVHALISDDIDTSANNYATFLKDFNTVFRKEQIDLYNKQ